MSENHEVHRNKPNRRLRLAGILDKLTGRNRNPEPEADYEREYKKRQRQRLDQRPAGPGLKGYDLELKLFRYSTELSDLESRPSEFYHTFNEVIGRYRQEGKDIEGQFHDDSEDHPFESLMYSSSIQSRSTERLSEWLQGHVPQNGYFTPEMLIEAFADTPSISVAHEMIDGIVYWTFSNDRGERFTLSRPQDESRPSIETKPYLAVKYSSEYNFDAEEVLATPKLSFNGDNEKERAALKGSLGDTVKASLGIQPVRISQKIEFQVIDAKPVPYLASADVHSLESITAQAYVLADLPQEIAA